MAGAYGYVLQQDPADGGWYLRSSLTDPGTPQPGGGNPGAQPPLRYQPGVPVYEAYANTLLQLSKLPTLRQRSAIVSMTRRTPAMACGAAWKGRRAATTRDVHDRRAPGHRQLEGAIRRGPHTERRARRLPPVAGLAFHYGKADTRLSSAYGKGNVDTTVYGLTPTLTWYGANGVYVDVQAQANWFDSDLKSRSAGTLRNGAKAHGYGWASRRARPGT